MTKYITCVILILVTNLFFAPLGIAQDAQSSLETADYVTGKSVDAVRLETAPKIDGILTPGEWNGAAVVSDFHQLRPNLGIASDQRTIVHIGYDDDYIYIGARLYDDNPEAIVANRMVQGTGIFGDDRFRVVLGPFNNRRSGFRFETNPNGIRQEALGDGPDSFNFNWRAIWDTAATIDGEGWVAEMRIPFKTLNFDPNRDIWGISFARNVARTDEESAWTSFAGRNTVQALGEWVGVAGAKQGVGLDIIAGATPRFTAPDGGENGFEVTPTLDLIYKITPSLTGLVTVNTDFSTADVDDQVVNLTRFNIFFPERRDFFLQDADIFQFAGLNGNGNPFFSRTIGLDQDGVPLDLNVGAKVAGRIGDLNIGVLDVVQDQADGTGSANLFVGRASLNVLENSSIGAIVTHGDPVTGAGSYTIGFDALYRSLDIFEGKSVNLQGFWLDTQTADAAGGLELGDDTSAYGVNFDLDARAGIDVFMGYEVFGEDYNPALGFVNRPGTEAYFAFLGYAWRPEKGFFRLIDTAAIYDLITDRQGNTQSERIVWRAINLENRTNDRLTLVGRRRKEVLDAPFEIIDGITIPSGEYEWNEASLEVDTASFRTAGIFASYEKGGFFSGERSSFFVGVRYSPSRHFTMRTSYDQSDVELLEGDFLTRVYSLRTDVAFNAEWSWITRLQYDNVSQQGGINSRLRYNPAPGQNLFLVLNQGFQQVTESDIDGLTDRRFRATDTDLALRVFYTFRF